MYLVLIAVVVLAAITIVLWVCTGAESGNRPSGDLHEPSTLHVAPALRDGPVPSVANARDLSDLLPPQFVVLDLETTGLNPHTDEIIEIGAVRVTLSSENHEAFQVFVKPTGKIPAKIVRMTGITQEMVDRDGLPIHDALSQFVEFIGDLPLVTFNAAFDMGFLHAAGKREEITISNKYACALKRARRAWPGLQSYKLIDLARMGNLSTVDAHRAIGDSVRALIVFTAATSQLGQKVRWTQPTVN